MAEQHSSLLKRVKVMSSLYVYANRMAESRQGSNSGIAAGTAATLLEMGLDHYDKSDLSVPNFTDAEIEQLESIALSASEHNSTRESVHFMDKFMEKLLQHTIAEDSEGLAELQSRASDPARTKRAPLSIRILISNLKRLSAQMRPLFRLQYGAIHIATWRKPTKTLSVLVMYTALCCWPHLVIAFPLVFVLTGLIIPANLYRHPLLRPEFLPVKKRGQSLMEFLNQSNDYSVVLDLIHEEQDSMSDDTFSWSSKSSEAYGPAPLLSSLNVDTPDDLKKKDNSKYVKSQVSLLMNMRDLQNLTTDVIEGMERSGRVLRDLLSFQDERLTTFVFYVLIALTFFVLAFGKYIPWRAIFILSGWTLMALCHPHAKKYLLRTEKMPRTGMGSEVEPKKPTAPLFHPFDSRSIIIDDKPEVRVVEIYELQVRDVLNREWKAYSYSKRLFDYKDKVRVAGKLVHGVDNLNKVLPPLEWKYDIGSAKSWHVDIHPTQFLDNRGVDQKWLEVRQGETEGWIYDKIPETEDSITEFRRRRLYRQCFRYARPVRELRLV